MYWDEEIETLPRRDLEALQRTRLRETLARAGRSPFYGRSLEGRLRPDEIGDVHDIRELPFTTKDDHRTAFPAGMLAVPQDDIERLYSSSGTTGTATVGYHTWGDIEDWADIMARSVYMGGVRRADVFQNIVGYGWEDHFLVEILEPGSLPRSEGKTRRVIDNRIK